MKGAVKLEVTEEYVVNVDGSGDVQINYMCSNEQDKPISNFSKTLSKEFDATNVEIERPIFVSANFVAKYIGGKSEKGRTTVEWLVEREKLMKGEPCICILKAKWHRLVSRMALGRLGVSYVLRVSYIPPEHSGYTLIVSLPKPSALETIWWRRLIYAFHVDSNPPSVDPVDPRNPRLKWRMPTLNDRFDVVISYGFRFREWIGWLTSALIAFITTIVAEYSFRFLVR